MPRLVSQQRLGFNEVVAYPRRLDEQVSNRDALLPGLRLGPSEPTEPGEDWLTCQDGEMLAYVIVQVQYSLVDSLQYGDGGEKL